MSDKPGEGLSTENLKIGYDTDLIDSICINVLPGKIVTLIGPNGCGKSTLLKTLMGSLKSRGGVICLSGNDRSALSVKETARSVSMVMTKSPLPELMTCREVIESGRYPYTGMLGRLSDRDVQAVSDAIGMCGCDDIAGMLFTNISDGQRQRVMLARAIAQEPSVLVLDEPTSYLDIRYKTDILTKIRTLAAENNIAVLMSVHEPETAMRLSDTVVALGDGQVLRIGTPQEVFEEDFIRKLYNLGDIDVGRFSGRPWFSDTGDATGTSPDHAAMQTAGHTSPGRDRVQNVKSVQNSGASVYPGRIMIQGTMSNVGKSVIVAGLCRIFAQDGYSVAPFKSQNMANNSFITPEGLEMGRAQVMQAECAKIAPDVCMNPILLKPLSDKGSQVIVNGRVIGNMDAKEYFEYKKELMPVIMASFEELERSHDIVVIEGAGSPAEINLKENDIVNMGLAKMLGANVLLAGDIDRGGVFAQLLGTLDLLESDERELVKGLIINKFRGDVSLLDPGIKTIEEMSDLPVIGVVPYIDLHTDDEDSLTERFATPSPKAFDIAVIRLPHIANFTDLGVFEQSADISVRYITKPSQLGDPDMIVIPGTKNTVDDMKWLDDTHLSDAIKDAAARSAVITGICGGFQMLGRSISDPEGVEGGGSAAGLGLLDVETVIKRTKTCSLFRGCVSEPTGVFETLKGYTVSGYEIHMGQTVPSEGVSEFTSGGSGYCSGNIYGTYIHGIFDERDIAAGMIGCIAKRRGKMVDVSNFKDRRTYKEEQYDALANTLRDHLDMKAIYEMAGLRHD